MAELYGWAENILDVNLTTGKITKKPLPKELALKYIGGRCLAARILYDEVGPETDPLGPDNVLIVTSGALGGTLAPSSGRWDVASKSPFTGIYGGSSAGGFFGPELKWAGYELVIIRGKSEKPVYLWIDDDDVEIRDASHIWGQDTYATERMIHDELGDPDIKTIKIGPAGENICFSSTIIGDLGRAAGRTSIGMVWGAKKLKAIAARGTKGVRIAKPLELQRLTKKLNDRAKQDPLYPFHTSYGTGGWVFDWGRKPGYWPRITGEILGKDFYDKDLSCFNCDLHCKHHYTVKEGKYKGVSGEGPEGACMLHWQHTFEDPDPGFILKFQDMCNRLGIHCVAPAYAINWARTLLEEGIITKDDTGGIEIKQGDEETALELTRMMAYKEGFGKILDEYPTRAPKTLGKGELYAPSTKGSHEWGTGLEVSSAFSLGWSVATRGGDHLTGAPALVTPGIFPSAISDEHLHKLGKERYGDRDFYFSGRWATTPNEARMTFDTENTCALCDVTGVCKFKSEFCFFTAGIHPQDFADLLSAATGIDFTAKDLVKTGERQNIIQRAFNAREGIRRKDDFPYALRWQLEHNMEVHPHFKDKKLPMDVESYGKMLDEYYKLRGCDLKTGIPTRKKLEEIDLKDVADDLEKRGILPTAKK